ARLCAQSARTPILVIGRDILAAKSGIDARSIDQKGLVCEPFSTAPLTLEDIEGFDFEAPLVDSAAPKSHLLFESYHAAMKEAETHGDRRIAERMLLDMDSRLG